MKTSHSESGSSSTSADEAKEAAALDVTLGRIAADVYAREGSVVDGWRPVTAAELTSSGMSAALFKDDATGFVARLYTNGTGAYVLAFRGTDEGKDWTHNIRQGLGLDDAQYDRATRLSSEISQAFGRDNLVITGHSLGGGLASVASLKTGSRAVTFNAAGLHDRTIEDLHLDPASAKEWASAGQIRRYAVDNEILTELQEHKLLTRWLLPDAIGHRIDLPDPDPLPAWKRLVPGASLKHGVDVHGMDAVLRAQQLAQPSLGDARHPGHALYQQSLEGLRKVDPGTLGYRSEHEYENAAATLATHAAGAGLRRIDHVVPSLDGGTLFAVEGRIDEASHRLASIATSAAARQPVELSSAQFPASQEPQTHATPERRAVLAH